MTLFGKRLSLPDVSSPASVSLPESPSPASSDAAFFLRIAFTGYLVFGVAFVAFGKKMKGYYTNDAQVVGVESRTSSPVKIPRDKETLEHPQIRRLFPCGEGAGYAGGIVSAAMDGERCAISVLRKSGSDPCFSS